MGKKKEKALLLYGSSDADADIVYFSGMHVPDPFIALQIGEQKKVGVLNQLEFARAQKESMFDECLLQESLIKTIKKEKGIGNVQVADIVLHLSERFNVKNYQVASHFPYGLAFELSKRGVELEVCKGSLFPEREIKSCEELAYIKAANKGCAVGFQIAKQSLKKAVIKNNKLYLEGKALTSENLRLRIEVACLEAGLRARHTIVAGGGQACDPHCQGSGFLRPNELIIIDIFPQHIASGYYGDMTRTFLKGQASDAQTNLVNTVLNAQQLALENIKPGMYGAAVHEKVVAYFNQEGYQTSTKESKIEGFFHSLGHGLGLDLHELPRLGPRRQNPLKVGHVITVEPGLYYPEIGGCRIEDVVVVKENGYEKLSSSPYEWKIK